MKKWLALMMTVGLLLSGCAKETLTEETTAAATEITVPATQSTERIQSVLYLPDYTTEQIQEYFTTFCAAAVIVAVPITALFMWLQKYYVQGVTGGAVKG